MASALRKGQPNEARREWGLRNEDGFADVYVSQDEPIERNRYTVGHEVAHLLIAASNKAKDLGIAGSVEESLCDVFASRLLIGRRHLRRHVEGRARLGPSDFLELCRRFGVSLSAMANALADVWQPRLGLLFVGRQGTEGAAEYRVSTAVCSRPWFVPKGMTFGKLGLDSIVDWLCDATGGQTSVGTSPNVSVVLWDPASEIRRSGKATIRGSYDALRLRNGLVVVSLTWSRDDVELHWYDRSRPSAEADG